MCGYCHLCAKAQHLQHVFQLVVPLQKASETDSLKDQGILCEGYSLSSRLFPGACKQ